MALQTFSTPVADFGNRWAMPAANVFGGGCAALGGLALLASGALPIHGAAAIVVLGAASLLSGLAALVWRVAAGRPVAAWRARKRELLADTAVMAGWLPICLALFLWGAHGLIDDARRPFVIVGDVQEFELHRGRGRSARLWIAGVPHAYHWRCQFDCRPWDGLGAVADAPGQRVRATVIGRRLIGLDVDGRRLLSPGPERRRWIVRDVALTGIGGFLTLAFIAGVVGKARDLRDSW